jgi:FkbM family methyltransferase
MSFQRLHGTFKPGRSQNREDEFILAYFGDFVGRFLDVGALDGVTISNSYALAEKGWGGVCVEPDPQALEGLERTHGENPNIVIAPVAISTCGGFMPFYNSRSGGVSTLSEAHRDKWASDAKYETIEVLTITPAALLQRHPGPYSFFSLDIEGCNADVFEQFPLSDMGTELVCVEHDGEHRRILAHCAAHGLKRVAHENAENILIAK